MAEMHWEKSAVPAIPPRRSGSEQLKFLVGGGLLLAAVVYLIVSGTATGARYFMSVDELLSNSDYIGRSVRISGAVIGDSIVYDGANLVLDFSIAHVPSETDDLALSLHNAVNDPTAARIPVHIEGEVKPDLLQHEAQAILSGTLSSDGTFYATELLLKCPSRYEEAVPGQVEGNA
jgi:cytochrome c-type biogenesis protein CcmE